MTEYSVLFVTKINAKSKADLERRAEKYEEILSKALRKPIHAYGYGKIEKKDTIATQTTLD